MSLDKDFKDSFSEWCTKTNRGLVSRGDVMGAKKGISCRCRKSGREIKVTEGKIRVNSEEYHYDRIYFDSGSLFVILDDSKHFTINPKDFFG